MNKKDIFSIIVPTYNPGNLWQTWCACIDEQKIKNFTIIQIDSNSDEILCETPIADRLICHIIPRAEFNHGGTRNFGASLADNDVEYLVFMTQDALLTGCLSLEILLEPFRDPTVAAVCGRQLPHDNANAIAAHARFFNYPAESSVKSLADKSNFGLKTAFMSNSFAAYRKSVFDELGGFPHDAILAEDMYLTAKMLLAGYKIAYAGGATVKHSHNYSIIEEFKRYFDIGVFHSMEPWIMVIFGKAEGEGKKFVLSEIQYLLRHNPFLLPKAFAQTFAKYFGYKLGGLYKYLPLSVCKQMSMTKSFWNEEK
ncbi:glycosyltransferase family 2 protein [Thorsellia anophelis]|uniref:Rhamnosyltransferase n=1 Tax=Thorsellia anophelis DSM 18579 TaxID=1123402 RepID=A0A1I0G016_9GAMM|nr:glycosyltransferase family 2 protein [Thorsellia anophelis]SET63160.1 rhamnosyltransferase [Thorsellia anophelis DSM 18579]